MRFYPNFGSQSFSLWLNSLLPTFRLLKDSITSTIKDIYKSAADLRRESDRTFILSINRHIEAAIERSPAVDQLHGFFSQSVNIRQLPLAGVSPRLLDHTANNIFGFFDWLIAALLSRISIKICLIELRVSAYKP
jgi:hypothetical protein